LQAPIGAPDEEKVPMMAFDQQAPFRHGRWGRSLLIIVAMAAATGMTALAGPAMADVPDRDFYSASSDNNSEEKGAVVTCPEGTRVVAAGADVGGDGRGSVIIDDLIPTDNTVTAYGFEGYYDTTQSWFIRAWAICGNPRGSVRTATRESQGLWNRDQMDVTVTCPDGMVVLGTGASIRGGQGNILIESIVPTTHSVTVSASKLDYNVPVVDWWVAAHATCGDEPGGREIVSRITAGGPDDAFGSAPCDAGKVALGGGFAFSGGLRGRMNLGYMIPTNSGVTTHASEITPTTYDWSLRSYAICVNE
jgi:hypothetical protein